MRALFPLFFVLFMATAQQAASSPLPNQAHVYVEGSAEVEVVPDQMTISVGISETNQKVAVAKQEVDARSRRLIQACEALDIAVEDLQTTSLQVMPAFDYRGGEQIPLGTRVHREVKIRLRDLSKYSQLMAALMDSEISETLDTRLEVADEGALEDDAMAAALTDARQRAEAMARAMGRRLGEAYSVSEFDSRREERRQLYTARGISGPASTNMPLMELRSEPDEPFVPGVLVARARVYVVFLLR